MALTFSLVDTWDDGKRVHVSGTIVASGNYTTSGDTLDLSEVPLIASDQPPVQGTAWMDGLVGIRLRFLSRRRDERKQSENLSTGRVRRPFPRTRRRSLSNRNHRRHHHVLRHLQKTAVEARTNSIQSRYRDKFETTIFDCRKLMTLWRKRGRPGVYRQSVIEYPAFGF